MKIHRLGNRIEQERGRMNAVSREIEQLNDVADGEELYLREQCQWDLVWHDEFEQDKLDLNKWEYQVDCLGGGNNEQQCYTSNPENLYFQNGYVYIHPEKVVHPSEGQTKPYTSAHISSRLNGSKDTNWKYGRVLFRAKLPRVRCRVLANRICSSGLMYELIVGYWAMAGNLDDAN